MQPNFVRHLPGGHPESGMGPSDMVSASAFITDDQTETIYTFWESDDASITTGVWECAPCREEIPAYPVNEMMTVISGSVTITNANGESDTFSAGDTFFIAKGTQLVWEITETLRKFYFIAA